MTEQRRFLERSLGSPTVIGENCIFVGNLRGAGQFVVSGEVEGDGELNGDLNLAVSGTWQGHIQARRAIIAGKIFGSLHVAGKLEIGHTAVIRGSVSAQTIAIAKGAVIGKLVATVDGKPLGEAPIVAQAAVERAGFFQRLGQRISGWFSK
jgi:cytoskeletal protein CcmA (bactofilin family)